MKIGLVSPYVYPLPGGVTQHVRYLYENLRLRGHDVRILTSSHGLQRSSEGDVIRLGKGFSMPANGSVGTITVSPRFVVPGPRRARARAVRRPPLPRAVRAVPVARLLRESQSVNIGTFHAYGGFSPPTSSGAGDARATPAGSMAGSRSRPPPATSSTATSRATTRSSPTASTSTASARAVPVARWQDGTANILFVGRFEPRKGVLDLLKAFRILRKTGCDVPAAPRRGRARRSARRAATSRPVA